MTFKKKDLNDIANGALGAVKGVGDEFRTMAKSSGDKLASELDLVSRDEFDALKEAMIDLQSQVQRLREHVDSDANEDRKS